MAAAAAHSQLAQGIGKLTVSQLAQGIGKDRYIILTTGKPW